MVKLNVVLPPITMDQEASDVDRKRKSISAPDQYVKLPDISRHTHTAPVPKYFEANTTLMRTKVMKMKVPITNKLVKFKPGFKSKGSYREQYRPPTLKLCRDCQHFWRFFRKCFYVLYFFDSQSYADESKDETVFVLLSQI